jgi:hypothetical protein
MDGGFFYFSSFFSVSLLFLCCSILVRFQRRFQRFIFLLFNLFWKLTRGDSKGDLGLRTTPAGSIDDIDDRIPRLKCKLFTFTVPFHRQDRSTMLPVARIVVWWNCRCMRKFSALRALLELRARLKPDVFFLYKAHLG